MIEKQSWLVRAKETYEFHRSKLLSHDKWDVGKTARALKRSSGSISEDLLIARWSKTHGKFIENFDTAREAIQFIRKKKREYETGEIE